MFLATRSERYFVDLFQSATLRGAIERAVRRELEQLFEAFTTIPVDVFRLAERKRIQISEDLAGNSCEEGLLIPYKGGYRVRLRKSSTESRKRFSLAHEVGHTLFYKDEGTGPRHQVGVLNAAENAAEERICNFFAGALLMPSARIREELTDLPTACPSRLLAALDNTARRFRVSPAALVQRLRSIELQSPPYLLLCLSSRVNPATETDIALRVDACVSLGSYRKAYIWRNRSALGMGLNSALLLYNQWARGQQTTAMPGCFSLATDSALVPGGSTQSDTQETIQLSCINQGKWKNEFIPVISANRLYVWREEQEKKAYIISALAPTSELAATVPRVLQS